MSEISRKTGELYESPLTYEEIRWFRKFKKECDEYSPSTFYEDFDAIIEAVSRLRGPHVLEDGSKKGN